MGLTDPFGIDLSEHNGHLNWATVAMHDPKVEFGYARTGISWGYTDPLYAEHYDGLIRINALPCAYHVLYPGENAMSQVKKFLSIAGKEPYYHIWDLEVRFGDSPAIVQACVRDASMGLLDAGCKVAEYTSPDWSETFLCLPPVDGVRPGQATPDYFNRVDWIIAQYLLEIYQAEHPGPVEIPWGVPAERVIVHQSWNQHPGIGQTPDNPFVDADRWLHGPVPSRIVVPTMPALFEAICIREEGVNTLAVPMDQSTDLHQDLANGDRVSVYEVDGATGWLRIDQANQRWVTNSLTYMQYVRVVPPPVVDPPITDLPYSPLDKAHVDLMWKYFEVQHPKTQMPS